MKGQPPHCNEQWVFKNYGFVSPIPNAGLQKLQRLACLCEDCHMVKHLGYARTIGKLDPTIKHMAKINNWPIYHANHVADLAFHEWEKRNQYQWLLDLSYLKTHYGLELEVTLEQIKSINDDYMSKIMQREDREEYEEDIISHILGFTRS